MSEDRPLVIDVGGGLGTVSGLLTMPARARAVYVMAHGAGAGMRHAFLEATAHGLAARDIGTLRFQLPYMEAGRSRPDPPAVAVAAVRAAVDAAGRAAPGLPLIAGGKSFGGRMTSTAQADAPLPGVRGLVFFGFPLHPPGRPGTARADHLARVTVPTLLLQGTRDEFADLALLRGVCDGLGPRATLYVVEDADHSFHVRKRSGRTDRDVHEDLLDTLATWLEPLTRQ